MLEENGVCERATNLDLSTAMSSPSEESAMTSPLNSEAAVPSMATEGPDESSEAPSDASVRQLTNGHSFRDSPNEYNNTETSENNGQTAQSDALDQSLFNAVLSTSPPVLRKLKTFVDTRAPFESVKEVVSKYGGIVDWKAHKTQTAERQKYVEHELEKTYDEIPEYQRRSKDAEFQKVKALEALDRTKSLIDELNLKLEKVQMEENQAKQDSELARLRVEEIEQGIANEASVAAKAQLEVSKFRYNAAVEDLKLVRNELDALKREYVALDDEKNIAVKRAEEVIAASKESEKTLEEMTIGLIMEKESLEYEHAAHLEAEEKRIAASTDKEKDELNWMRELEAAEEEVKQLNEQLESTKETKYKLYSSTQVLLNLKSELVSYKESQLTKDNVVKEEISEDDHGEMKQSEKGRQTALSSAKMELEEVKANIEKANEDVKCLRVAAVSLNFELEREKAALTSMREIEGLTSVALGSLESELTSTIYELESMQKKERETREEMEKLPTTLQQAAQDADQGKMMAKLGREEHRKAKEEAEQVTAEMNTTKSRLNAALKEIEASKASERLSLAAVKALQESRSGEKPELEAGVTLTLEEYYTLSKQAHEAEQQANMRVLSAIAQIEVTKESERQSLKKLEEVYREMNERKENLRVAIEKAEGAQEGKLGAEHELRIWRSENEQRRRASDAGPLGANPPRNSRSSFERMKEPKNFDSSELSAMRANQLHGPKVFSSESDVESVGSESKVKKKRHFFPRIVMFLARWKAHSKAT